MEISITLRCLKAVQAALGEKSDQLGPKSYMHSAKKPKELVPVSLDELDLPELVILQAAMKEHEEDETRKVSKLINTLKDTANRPISSLKDFPRTLKQYLQDNGNPMLHSLHASLRGVAYLPIEVSYRAADYKGREKESVSLRLAYNSKMSLNTYSIELGPADRTLTVPQILRSRNLMVPDESMTEEYVKIQARFEEYGKLHGEQFWCRGEAPVLGGDRWWASDEVEMTQLGRPTKAVLDVEAKRDYYRSSVSRASFYSDIYEKNCPVPTHPVLPMFSLVHHKTVWVNVVNMKKYKYEEDLGEKLVLPSSHTRLIGALVHNLDALRDENEAENKSRTIKAKASSSIILSKGAPGTGKTLAAEVYGEEIKRPLYEVQSGQIGVEPDVIEENLKDILNRSVRLKMPLLINEADVFIKKRGDDAKQNAIVSVFLRLLEYHTGLVFLTTNRDGDIDDAILSRCIARINFPIPAPKERLRLWKIMLSEFNVELPKSDLRKAVLAFPKIVGRDIQNLIRLTNRVCIATNTNFCFEELRENAIFQDIHVLSDTEIAPKEGEA